jgi:hypothetical protein
MSLPVMKGFLLFGCALVLVFNSAGCESLGRKFVRKPKVEDINKEEVIYEPQEYKSESLTNQDLYRQYFLYWRTWQDEFIDSLEESGNRKKQLNSLNEAIRNLENIKVLLNPEVAAKLDVYIKSSESLGRALNNDIYGNNVRDNRRQAELLKRDVLSKFSFNKIKDSIK